MSAPHPDADKPDRQGLFRQINPCLIRDQYQLRRIVNQLGKTKDEQKSLELQQRFRELAESSQQIVCLRRDHMPDIKLDQSLPIFNRLDEIGDALRNHPVTVISGATGSGKSTQLPLIAMQLGFGIKGLIGHTQPRRIAARSIASRISSQIQSPLGNAVGFKIRFDDKTSDKTYLKLMTDGILLAETQSDRFLDQYELIIIDEAHERSLNIDFLLGNLKRILEKRRNLKLIITSATIDTERFAEHFQLDERKVPTIDVEGRTYPVEIRYQPEADADDAQQRSSEETVVAAVKQMVRDETGDLLVFLPTEKDIRTISKKLKDLRHVDVLPLYARLSNEQQSAIFETGKRRRVVLATNVAESSITVPGIRIVIDSGTARISRYAPRSKVQRLPIEPVSQASADQRAGRCGRIGPGICVRLYSEEDYLSRAKFTTPEIRRTNLASVILQTLSLKLGEISQFPFIDMPQPDAIADGYRTLFEIGAIESGRKLTPLGKWLSKLPIDPRIGRILHAAGEEGCLNEVLIIASALEIQDPRIRPAEKQKAADQAHEPFLHERSDFMSYLKLWDFVHQIRKDLSRSKFRLACQKNFLSMSLIHQWMEIHRQIKNVCRQNGLQVSERKDDYDAIHRSMLAGFLSGIANLTEKNEYTGAGGIKFHLWPGSGVFAGKPKWIMTAEIVETTRRYGRTVARIDPSWIEPLSGHLAKSSFVDPHWSKKRQTVMAYENISLFGLPIVNRRRTGYTRIDAETARELFIDDGVCEFELQGKFGFLDHNRTLLDNIEQLAAKTRRRDLIFDTYQLREHYFDKMPNDCLDTASLRRAIKRNPDLDHLLRLDHDAVRPDDSAANQFPDSVQVGSMELSVKYRFEPGQKTDGATVRIPEQGLSQLDDRTAGWLIPGMYEARIAAMIKSLPKTLRRNFVPAPETAKRIVEMIEPGNSTFPVAVANALSTISGETINPSMFDETKIDDSLSVFIQVVNDQGELLAEGRSANDLRKELGSSSNFLETEHTQWNRDDIQNWDWDELPKKLQMESGTACVEVYPTIVDQVDSVSLKLVSDKALAKRLTQHGVTRLFCLSLKRQLKKQINWLPDFDKHAVALSRHVATSELKTGIADLIIKVGLLGQPPKVPQNKTAFMDAVENCIEPISIGTQEVARWLPKLAQSVHQADLVREQLSSKYDVVRTDLKDQAKRLLNKNFLLLTPWKWLQHFPRYFEGIHSRCQKIGSGGIERDRESLAAIRVYESEYLELKKNQDAVSVFDPELEHFRWMIEEYRISLFAQQLGTAITVSDKRLSKQLAKVARI